MLKFHLIPIIITYYIAGMLLFYVVADLSVEFWKQAYYLWNLSWEPLTVLAIIYGKNRQQWKIALLVLAGFMLIRLLWDIVAIRNYNGVMASKPIKHAVITILSFTIFLLTFLPLGITAYKRLIKKWQ